MTAQAMPSLPPIESALAPTRHSPQLALFAIVLIAVGLRAIAFDPWSVIHVDEQMQYFERANHLVTGYGIVTWEERYGIRNWIFPQILALPIWIGQQLAPGTLAAATAARCLCALAGLTTVFSAFAIARRQSDQHGLVAAFAIAVWFQSVYFSISLLSENIATAAILGAVALAPVSDAPTRKFVLTGFLLGVGVLFRFPYAIFAGVVAIGMCRAEPRRWLWLAAGIAAASLLGMLSDLLAGQTPYLWLLQNIRYNIVEGRAQSFGMMSAWFYPLALIVNYGVGIACVLVLGILCPARYRFLLLAAAADMFVHSLLSHKELRFVYLSTSTLVILAAMTSVDLLNRIAPSSIKNGMLSRTAPFYLWLVLSATSWLAIREVAPIQRINVAGRLTHQVVRADDICGIAVSDQFRFAITLANLGRNVPLYSESLRVSELTVPDPARFPDTLAVAANAIVASGDAAIPAPYRAVSCSGELEQKVCVFVRPGPCNPEHAAPYTLQNVLIASDL